jgi:hypothetical protein
MTRPIDDISGHMGKLHRAWSGLGAALSRPLRQTGIFAAGRFLGRGIGGIGHMLTSTAGLLGVAGIGGAAMGIFGLTKRTSEFAEELDRSAYKLGTTVQGLQKLRYAAKMSDVEIEAFDTSMGFLTRSIGAALGGDKKKSGLFAAMGIDLKKTKDTQSVFLQIANTLSKIKNTGIRNQAMTTLFGRGGLSMSAMFRGGSAEIERLMKERESFGLISQDDIAKSESFQREWKRFGFVLEGIRNTFGLEMMPKLTEGIVSLKGLLIENMPRIKSTFKDFAGYFTKERVEAFIEYASAWASAINTFIIKPLMRVAEVSTKAGHLLFMATHPIVSTKREMDETQIAVDKYNAKRRASSSASSTEFLPNAQKSSAAAAAAAIAPKNSVITEKNEAVLQIKIMQDGKAQASMLGGLGQNINLGWSMVQ